MHGLRSAARHALQWQLGAGAEQRPSDQDLKNLVSLSGTVRANDDQE